MSTGVKVEINVGDWVDITDRVRVRDNISISRGRSPNSASLDPSRLTLTLDNRDGLFSPRNPLSPYYGVLNRNTPIRVSVPYGSTALVLRPRTAGQMYASNHASITFAGDLDARLFADLDQWRTGDLCGKWWPSDGWYVWKVRVDDGRPSFIWSPTGNASGMLFATATEALPVRRGKLALRVTMDVSNPDGVWEVRFYTSDSLDGEWSQLGDPVTGSSSTSFFTGSEPSIPLWVGDGEMRQLAPSGRYLGFELRNGIDGTLVAAPDFTAATPGSTTFLDPLGRSWKIWGTAEITDRQCRFWGEVSKWPQAWDLSGADGYVAIEAYGYSRRFTLNAPPLRSAMYRTHVGTPGIIAYWPMEDGESATQLASPMSDVPAMRIDGSPQLAAYSGWTSSDPMPIVNNAAFTARIPASPVTGMVSTRAFVFVSQAVSQEASLMYLETTGTASTYDLRLLPDGSLRLVVRADDNKTLADTAIAFAMNGRGFTITGFELEQQGSNIAWTILVLDFINTQSIWDIPDLWVFSGMINGRTVGRPKMISVGRDKRLGQTVVGHLLVANDLGSYGHTWEAIAAHNGEYPEDRAERLCDEEDVPLTVVDGGTSVDDLNAVQMGDQLNATLLDLLEEVATTELGILAEPRDAPGLLYRSRRSLVNQDPIVRLDYSAGHIAGVLQPVDDDDHVVNDITVRRIDGSSIRMEQDTGPLSVAAPPDGVGRYANEVSVSLMRDRFLPDQAGFRLHLGTAEGVRYPELSVALHSPRITPEMRSALLRADVGDRIDLTGFPVGLPPDDVSQLVEGYSEEIGLIEHTITFALSPESPWRAGEVDAARVDTAGSVLAADVGTGEPTEPDPLGVVLYRWSGAGIADGTPVTHGLAGTGDTPLDLATTGAATVQGGRIKVDQQSGQAAQFAWQSATLGTSRSRFGARATYELTGYTSGGNGRLLSAYTSSSALLWFTTVMPSGILRIHNPSSTAVATSAAPLPLNTPFRLDATHLDGVVSISVVVDGEVVETISGDVGTGSTAVHEVRFGMPNIAPTWPTFYMDDLQFTDPDAVPPAEGETLLVASSGPLWTTDLADFPFDVMVGGERMTVTQVSGSTSPQTFTVTRSVNGVVKGHTAGTAVVLAEPSHTAY